MSDSKVWGSGRSMDMHLSPDGVLRRCVSPGNCRYKAASIALAERRDKEREQRILDVAARLFHENLLALVSEHPRCAAARDLARRRIPAADPCLGWIPSGRKAVRQLAEAGVTAIDLLEAGLADTRRDGACLQFYAHDRLTLAVVDEAGRTAGFYARSYAEPAASSASLTGGLKYVASRPPAYAVPERDPESNLCLSEYVKPLFLADRAASAAKAKRELYVVEGQFDALACWYAGVDNVVSIAGCTDFYESNLDACLKLMGGQGKVIFSLDNDEAGRAGLREIARRFPDADIDVREPFADGKDPCDYRAEHGGEALMEALGKHKPIMQALVEDIPLIEVPMELSAVSDPVRRRELASHAAAAHGRPEMVGELLSEASTLTPRAVITRGRRYKDRRRWVKALGLAPRSDSQGKSFIERVASSEAMQLMVRLAAAADSAGEALPRQVVSRLPKQLREAGAVSELGLDSYHQEGDDVGSLLALAKTKIWRDLQ